MPRSRRQRDELAAKQQRAWEQDMTRKAIRKVAAEKPGVVVHCGTDLRLDLSDDDSTHVEKLEVDGSSIERKRLRVYYHAIGSEMDFHAEYSDEEWYEDADEESSFVRCEVEMFPTSFTEDREELMERIESFIEERWVPDYSERKHTTTNWDVLDDDEAGPP